MWGSATLAQLLVTFTVGTSALPAAAQQATNQAPHVWTQVTTITALPAGIQRDLGGSELISDRGGPFNPGCIVVPGAPSSRFVLAAVDGDVVVVAVERGGIAHYVETLEFRQARGQWTLASSGHASSQLSSTQELLATHTETAQPVRKKGDCEM